MNKDKLIERLKEIEASRDACVKAAQAHRMEAGQLDRKADQFEGQAQVYRELIAEQSPPSNPPQPKPSFALCSTSSPASPA